MKNTKYLIALFAITILASCGTANQEQAITEDTNTQAQVQETQVSPATEAEELIKELIEESEDTDIIQASAQPEEIIEAMQKDQEELETPEAESTVEIEEEAPVETENVSKVELLETVYNSPGGPETVVFNVSIRDDIIDNVSLDVLESSPVGDKYLARFESGINDATAGLTIQEASEIPIVSGSSLTTKAFTTALKGL